MAEVVQIGVQPLGPGTARAPKPRTVVLWSAGRHAGVDAGGVRCSCLCGSDGTQPGAAGLRIRQPGGVALRDGGGAQWVPKLAISERKASRAAGVLLFALAAWWAAIAVMSFVLRMRPETSRAGIAITVAALIAMPVLAALKRREARRERECRVGRGCGAVGNVRLPGGDHTGGAGGECDVPHCVVRFAGRAGGGAAVVERGQSGVARPCMRMLLKQRYAPGAKARVSIAARTPGLKSRPIQRTASSAASEAPRRF